jgi:L-fuconolactonase|tara:strand:- start:5026 stop:5859 length:834 start_codon:yes stop_codon:yes gene_type:complete
MKKIDAHQHFWRRSRGDYSWLTAELGPIYKDFEPAHLLSHLQGHAIDGAVVVQAADTLEETAFLLSLADEHAFIKGVVGWVDMESEAALGNLELFHHHSAFKGIRPMIQDIADPNWMLKPELDAAFNKLIELDLSFDALVLPIHLEALLTLLKRYPALRVVIDHGAKPAISKDWASNQAWSEKLKRLADDTGAYCKLSGLLTEAGDQADYDTIAPYMSHLLNCFGSDRLMWGSDWPVLNLAADYSAWLGMTERFVASLAVAQQQNIYADTAVRFYHL